MVFIQIPTCHPLHNIGKELAWAYDQMATCWAIFTTHHTETSHFDSQSTQIDHDFNRNRYYELSRNMYLLSNSCLENLSSFWFSFVLCRTAEHTLSLSTSIFYTNYCSNGTNLENFLKRAWPQIYSAQEYDGGVFGVLTEFINYYCVLQWVFMDLFIIAITICLSARFNQLNEHLKQLRGKVNSQKFYCTDFIGLLYLSIAVIYSKCLNVWIRKCRQHSGVTNGNFIIRYQH